MTSDILDYELHPYRVNRDRFVIRCIEKTLGYERVFICHRQTKLIESSVLFHDQVYEKYYRCDWAAISPRIRAKVRGELGGNATLWSPAPGTIR